MLLVRIVDCALGHLPSPSIESCIKLRLSATHACIYTEVFKHLVHAHEGCGSLLPIYCLLKTFMLANLCLPIYCLLKTFMLH